MEITKRTMEMYEEATEAKAPFGVEDAFYKHFDDEKEFIEFMSELKSSTTWLRPEVRDCILVNWAYLPIGGADQIHELEKNYYLVASDVAYEDAGSELSDYSYRQGSQMFLAIKGGETKAFLHPLSGNATSGAYRGWIQRIGMDCPSVPKLPLWMQEEVLNKVATKIFDVANKSYATAKFIGGKIRALNGGNYAVLDQTDMVKDVFEHLNNNYSSYEFTGASYSHERTEMIISLPDETKLVDKYVGEIVARTGTTLFTGAVPMLKFSTSDIGNACATIATGIKIGSVEMVLGAPLKLEHKGNVSVETFKKEVIEKMFSYFEDNLKAMTSLASVGLKYPLNVFASIADKMALTKSHVKSAAEEMAAAYEDGDATALDVYYYLQETIAAMAKDSKVSNASVLTAQENLSRKLSGFDWTIYDMPAAIV